MSKVGFAILRGLLYAVALLPFWVLYGIADFIFVLMFYILRYRRKMVRKNLSLCFPEMGDEELHKTGRRFYRNFADYIVETIKLLHISDKSIQKRFRIENVDVVRRYLRENKGIVAYFAHAFNWEWAPSITLHCKREIEENGAVLAQIYRPLRNARFDALMLKLRSRFGSESISKHVALRTILGYRRNGTPAIIGFMSDQKPSHGDELHILNFLGRRTAVITGTEALARRLGMAVIYFDMYKERRGHYRMVIREMCEDASKTEPYQLTHSYFGLLEETITRNPAIWLWSHNRWKNTPPADADTDTKQQDNVRK